MERHGEVVERRSKALQVNFQSPQDQQRACFACGVSSRSQLVERQNECIVGFIVSRPLDEHSAERPENPSPDPGVAEAFAGGECEVEERVRIGKAMQPSRDVPARVQKPDANVVRRDVCI